MLNKCYNIIRKAYSTYLCSMGQQFALQETKVAVISGIPACMGAGPCACGTGAGDGSASCS